MNTIPLLAFFCFWWYSFTVWPPQPEFNVLHLEVENIRSAEGAVYVALYDREEAFVKSLKPYLVKVYKVPEDLQLQVQMDSIPYGRYAMAIYHDENNNGDLDKNLLGIPKEPYGFSNNPRAKWSAPTYEETAFQIAEWPLRLSVSIKKWKER